MNVSKWIDDVIHSNKRCAIPIMTHPGIELLGEKVLHAVTDGEIHYKAICALNEAYPQAIACTTIMDLTVEAEAFGAPLRMTDEEVPTVIGRLVSTFEEVDNLSIPSLDVARIPQYLKADFLAASSIDKPVFAGCIGPYSLAGRLFDMTEIMMVIYTEPQIATLLLEKCTSFMINYCQAIKATGVAGVIMAEPAAGLLSNDDCFQYSSLYVKQIIDAVQDDSFAVILHNCGNTGHCTSAMIKTGAKGYHFGNKADMQEALKISPADVLIMGNLDPVGILKMASPKEVKEKSLILLKETEQWKNFVLSTGCDVPPHVPIENISAFYKALYEFNEETLSM